MTHELVNRVPTSWDMALFEAKAMAFRTRRFLAEPRGVRKFPKSSALEAMPVIAAASSSLWNTLNGERERALTAGKIHNLRLATRALDGLEIPAGAVFSFWRQIGRCTRWRGYMKGRELREGCLIANIGGGLCQLSNALYEAALAAGFEIVERHAHSRVVPGSRAGMGRDATVFWNYVDLRFRSMHAFRIEARLTRDELVVAFRAKAPGSMIARGRGPDLRPAANDCTSCGETSCTRHDPDKPGPPDPPTAWLVDACWPEFSTLFASRARKDDALFLPQRLRRTERHAWPSGKTGLEKRATLIALSRAIKMRRAPRQGRALQTLILHYDRALARHYADRLSHLHTHLVIAQPLLPHLWRLGVLQGRSFDVLMERHPMALLQATLDHAKERYPESPTLGDFRADPGLVAAELEALAEARRLYTPHHGIAAFDPARTILLDWQMPAADPIKRGGRTILFPASALGRKGAYTLRDALQGLDIDLAVTGRARERDGGFWGDIELRELTGAPWPPEIAAIILPAVVEHQPRALLRALAAGLPVIATEACGLGRMSGLIIVREHDAPALRAQIRRILEANP